MNEVKRAIIIAAGMGKRMHPVTFEIPKPMVKVNGVRMIDTVIQGLHKNNIYEIYVVVGYLKEQFYVLEDEYPGLKLIENPYYSTCNNISSLYVARNYIEDVIVLDGDLLIFNDSVLSREFELSGYNVVWTDERTDEWLLQVKDNVITECCRTGGIKGWQLFSISRWSASDGLKLRKHLELEFEKKQNYQIYWDDVVMFCHFKEYQLGIRQMQKKDVVEIDNLVELVALDEAYKIYLNWRQNSGE